MEVGRVRAIARKVRLATQTQVTIVKRYVLISRMNAVPSCRTRGEATLRDDGVGIIESWRDSRLSATDC